VLRINDLESISFVGFVIEALTLVEADPVVIPKAFPVFVSVTKAAFEKSIGHRHSEAGCGVNGSHCKNVRIVRRRGASSGHYALADGSVHVRTLAGGNVDSHPRAAEQQSFLEFTFRDARAYKEPYAMVHWRIILNWCEVGNSPAAIDKMPFDGFLEREARKVSADDDLLVTCGFQVVFTFCRGKGAGAPGNLVRPTSSRLYSKQT
jgi:hypothetical protein